MAETAKRAFFVVGTFRDRRAADEAAVIAGRGGLVVHAVEAGLTGSAKAGGDGSAARFLGRIVWIIVWWSVVGGMIGAALGGMLTWTGFGPGSVEGAILQIVGWAIFGHLIAGIWAGYVLLADRSHPELSPAGSARESAALVRVLCYDRKDIDVARAALFTAGAVGVSLVAADAAS